MRKLLRDEPLVDSWEIHAFEAHPGVARRCRWRFWMDRSVRVVNAAVGSEHGTCKLFLNRNLRGSSIYRGKENVIAGREVEVPCTPLSRYLERELPVGWGEQFNIIKSNIEGAEWDVWHDLTHHDLVSNFNLWLGAREGYDGWSEDLFKIAGMESRADALTASLKKEGAFVYRFSCFDRWRPNSDIANVLHEGLAKETPRRGE